MYSLFVNSYLFLCGISSINFFPQNNEIAAVALQI